MTYIRAKNRQAHKKRMRLELPIATALLQRVRIASMKLVELSSVCNSDRRQRHYVCYSALRYTGDATGEVRHDQVSHDHHEGTQPPEYCDPDLVQFNNYD
jgi:hypothetical protein